MTVFCKSFVIWLMALLGFFAVANLVWHSGGAKGFPLPYLTNYNEFDFKVLMIDLAIADAASVILAFVVAVSGKCSIGVTSAQETVVTRKAHKGTERFFLRGVRPFLSTAHLLAARLLAGRVRKNEPKVLDSFRQ